MAKHEHDAFVCAQYSWETRSVRNLFLLTKIENEIPQNLRNGEHFKVGPKEYVLSNRKESDGLVEYLLKVER